MTSFVLLVCEMCVGWTAHFCVSEFLGTYNPLNWCSDYDPRRQ